MIELRAGDVECDVSPTDGGRLASLRIGGRELLVTNVAEEGVPRGAFGWGSFPMVPWAGRIRGGRFSFDGQEHAQPINLGLHAIHGTAFARPWSVGAHDGTSVTLDCPLGEQWPFGGVAEQGITLGEDRLACRLAVHAAERAMPAQVGWHPWFVKPDHAQVAFAAMYMRDAEHIPTGALVEAPEGPWDDCFVEPLGPIELTFGDLVVSIESDCTHWVVFDQLEHTTCVEPQSGPPDAFNSKDGTGCTRLEPGESLERTMTISWSTR